MTKRCFVKHITPCIDHSLIKGHLPIFEPAADEPVDHPKNTAQIFVVTIQL